MKNSLVIFRRAVLFLAALVTFTFTATAQTFLGTNAPGVGTNYSFTLGAGATNLSLVISNSASAYSYLLLKKGGTPTDTDFDFVSRLTGATNQVNLQTPEFTAGSYGLRVLTPAASAQHPFRVLMTTNRTDLRTAPYPVLKPMVFSTTGTLTNAAAQPAWHYFQVDVPTNLLQGWRIVLSTTGADADLYVHKSALPNTGAYVERSTSQPIDTVILEPAQATAGTWFIGVYLPGGPATNVNYTLSAELGWLNELAWDPGTADLGTQVYTNQSSSGGDYYFHISTLTTGNSAWRSALRVTSGEADLYLRYGGVAQTNSFSFASTRIGSDGFVLAQAAQFSAGQDWYLTVHATPGAQWTLLTGEAFVQQLPALAADASSSGAGAIGPEGMRFFKTSMSPGTLAWRLWLNGLGNQILVHKTKAPLPYGGAGGGYWDWSGNGQLLIVPPYFNIGDQCFVGVVGNPGQALSLDSRQQAVTDLTFNAQTNINVTGYGYVTFRVQVPVQQIAWQLNLTPSLGDPNVAVRRDNVPNEYKNDAYSDLSGAIGDSVTLVPAPPSSPASAPGLTDGTFYVTVYGAPPYTCNLTNGSPVITDVNYIFAITNDAPTRAGWRFYRVPNTAQQLGTYGWDLALSNQFPNTEIALRRNAVPGRWNYRNCDANCASSSVLGYLDYSGTQGFLQRPGHQADIWYIGIYQPAAALGSFVLTGQELTGTPLAFDPGAGTTYSVVNQPPLKWQYYIIQVPTNAFGWDLRLTSITSGDPRLVICRERLPYDLGTHTYEGGGWYYPWNSATWGSGYSWGAGYEWTGYSADANGAPLNGRLLQMGLGNPLTPGTYYVGVRAPDGATTPIGYTLLSRGIGTNFAIPVVQIPFAGGTVTSNNLPAREAAYFRVDVPTNTPSWKVRLAVTNEMMLAVQQYALPNVNCGGSVPTSLSGGRAVQKPGDEEYLLLPVNGQTNLLAGPYYFAIISEGQNPTGNRYGSNSSSFTLTSFGAAPTNVLGTLDISGATSLSQADTLRGGEVKFYTFTVPPGALGMEVWLQGRVANPRMTLRADKLFPTTADSYGRDNGQSVGWSDDNVISIATPRATNYTISVQADTFGGSYSNAAYTVRVQALTNVPLAFDGGLVNVTNHTNHTWRYFALTVPPNALGWDVRITNVTRGDPRLVVCRDLAPDYLGTGTYPGGGWYYPWNYTTWPSSNHWAAGYDWTGYYYEPLPGNVPQIGRLLQMGMGNPLEPGNYLIGVWNGSGSFPDTMAYSLYSRGIGTNLSIRVLDLPFIGSVSSNGLPIHEAAYYRVQVPAGAGSWKLRLQPSNGDAMLIVQKDYLPNVVAGGSSPVTVSGGRALQKPGVELHTQLPRTTEAFLTNGTYYLAVASEGQNPGGSHIGSNSCDFVLQSLGPVTTNQLGTVDASGLTDITYSDTIEGGDFKFHQFTVPPGTLNLEIRLENRVGNPHMTLRTGSQLIRGLDSYGISDGQTYSWSDDALINLVNPTVTNYTLTVQARSLAGGYSNASYTIRLHAQGLTPLVFDNGRQNVTNQPVGTWRYFTVTVPPGAFGWDLRLTNVTSGDPRLMIRRDDLPDSSAGAWYYPWNSSSWPSGNQWNATYDWSGWYYENNGAPYYGRMLQMGMGNPLSPGNYIVGVINGSAAAPMTYTLHSRGIGAGYTLPIGTAPFLGSITNNGLPAREAAYYRLEVPAGQPSWKVRLTSPVGESMFMLQRSNLPNVAASSYSPATLNGGRALQKPGNEHFLLLPESGQTTIPGGTYYLALASEGQNPGTSSRIGSNTCNAIFRSYGPLPELALGSIGGADLTHSNTLEGGEIRTYNFNIPPGTFALECRLDNPVGTPYMTLRQGAGSPTPYYSYGRNGGQSYSWSHGRLITLPNVASGLYSLTVQAESTTDASYLLRVRHLTPTNLAFDASLSGPGITNVVSGALADLQKQYFTVTVPALFAGSPVLGWKLDLDTTSGNPRMRVRKDTLPNDSASGNTPYVTSQATIVPPYLTAGTWYIEVQGQGASTFTLRSSALLLQRPAWNMPQVGGSVTTPGLPAGGPLFGDTGVSVTGTNLPADQGVDLEQGRMHYYAISIPSNNVGIIRTRLDAISGNPDLFIRAGDMPTLTHYLNGDSGGNCYDRYLNANTGSEYGNWVPLSGRFELQLPPGTWYLAVKASGNSNVRYRLRCFTGIITPLAYDGVSVINQTLAAGDWRYYSVRLPTNCPTSWNVTFAQNLGDVVMYVRDTTPPGHGAHVTDYRDWTDDNKNHGPYGLVDAPGTTNLACPPLRPGHAYYLGFRAVTDATFSLSSTTNSNTINYTNVIPFYLGFYSNTIPPSGVLKFRIDVPNDARRLILTTACSNTVQSYLEQGSAPLPAAAGSHANWSGTYTHNMALYNNTWPWIPGYMYFLLITNTTTYTQIFTLNSDGRNAATDDFEGDGLPDAWELACWPSIYSYNGTQDPDGDGVNNAEEYAEGTTPCDSTSYHPRLLVNAIGGGVTRLPAGNPTGTPPKVWYNLMQSIQLTATADPGYSFIGWGGASSGTANPLTVVMDGHKTISANFGITNNSGADYQFQLSLTSSVPAPPALQNIGAGNLFVTENVDGCPRTVLRFPQGNGLVLQPTASVVPTNIFTIAMLFRADLVTSWRRLVDFKAGTTDNGLYLQNGALYMYPLASGPAGAVLASNWVQVVITRDALKNVVGYVNGVQQFSVNDPSDHAVISGANALRFFKDNNPLSEETGGSVARIRLYAAPMTPAQVSLLDRTDCNGVPHFLTPWFDSLNVLNLPIENVTPGITYRLLASTNLNQWLSIVTNTPLVNPTVLQDTKATNFPNRAYRLVTP